MGVPDHPCPSFSHGWQVNPGCIVRKLCATITQSALQPFIPALHTSRKRTAASHTGTTHVKKAHCSLSYRHYTRQESALQPLIPALHTSRKRTAASHTGTTHVEKAHCSLSYRHYTHQESALQPLIPAPHTSRKRTAAFHTGTTHVKKAHCSLSYRHYTHQESALQPLIPALHTSRKRTAASHTGTTHFKKAHCSLSYRHYTRQESALQPLIPALHTVRLFCVVSLSSSYLFVLFQFVPPTNARVTVLFSCSFRFRLDLLFQGPINKTGREKGAHRQGIEPWSPEPTPGMLPLHYRVVLKTHALACRPKPGGC